MKFPGFRTIHFVKKKKKNPWHPSHFKNDTKCWPQSEIQNQEEKKKSFEYLMASEIRNLHY